VINHKRKIFLFRISTQANEARTNKKKTVIQIG